MMKTILMYVAIILAFVGCESTVDNPEWPEYTEQLVVIGSVRITQDDSALVECTVRRTLPLWEVYSQEKALWPTAHVQLDDGGQIHDIPLVSPGNARFSKQVLRSGSNRYTLLVSEGSKHARATLELEPLPTVFSSVRIDTHRINEHATAYTFRGGFHFNPEQNAFFVVHYQVKDMLQTHWTTLGTYQYNPNYDWYNYRWERVPGDTLIFKTEIYDGTSPLLTRFTIDAYSREYTAYDEAQYSYYGGDDFFGSPQKNPPFNVTGDGIGFVWYVLEGPPLEIKFSW